MSLPALRQRFLEQRVLRDAARADTLARLARLRESASTTAMAQEVLDTGEEYARLLGEGLLDLAEEDRARFAGGMLLGGVGLLVWLLRHHIGEVICGFVDGLTDSSAKDATTPPAPSNPTDPEHEP